MQPDGMWSSIKIRLGPPNSNSDRFDASPLHGRPGVTPQVMGMWSAKIPSSLGEMGRLFALVSPAIGSVVLTRLSRPDEAASAAEDVVRWMSEALGTEIVVRDVVVRCTYGRTSTKHLIDLRALADALGDDLVEHDPPRNPGCEVTLSPVRGVAARYFAFESGLINVIVAGRATEKATAELMREARETCSRFPKE